MNWNPRDLSGPDVRGRLDRDAVEPWRGDCAAAYPCADRLLICCDGGGSDGYRLRLWNYELALLASESGLAITVCHLPPGTSKWNKIEHRLFSHISMNWRGRPLTSHEVIIDLISATTTKQGLRIHAERDLGSYPTAVSVSDSQLKPLPSRPTASTASGTTPSLQASIFPCHIRDGCSSQGPKRLL